MLFVWFWFVWVYFPVLMFLPLIKKLWQRGQTQTQVPASDTIMYSAPFCLFYKYIPDEKYIRRPAGLYIYPLQNRICLWWKKSWTHLWLIIIYKTYKYVPLPKIDSITEKQSPLYGFHYWQKVHPLHLDRLRSMK